MEFLIIEFYNFVYMTTKRLTIEEFVLKAREIHGAKYGYDNVVNKNNKTKVAIYFNNCCNFFKQTKRDHIHSRAGCSRCSEKYSPTTEEFVKMAMKNHEDNYDYSNVIYIKVYSKVEIYCNNCGNFLNKHQVTI